MWRQWIPEAIKYEYNKIRGSYWLTSLFVVIHHAWGPGTTLGHVVHGTF